MSDWLIGASLLAFLAALLIPSTLCILAVVAFGWPWGYVPLIVFLVVLFPFLLGRIATL